MFITINALLLVLWLRLLPQRDEQVFFNPYVAGGLSLTDRIVQFLNPVFGALPAYAVSFLLLLFVLLFRGVALTSLNVPWRETIGIWQFSRYQPVPDGIKFSFVAFALLLHRVWVIDWVLEMLQRGRKNTRPGVTLSALAMPVAAIPAAARGFVLLAAGAGIGLLFKKVAMISPVEGIKSLSDAQGIPLLIGFALGSFLDILDVASQLMMIFIILTFVGVILRSQQVATFGNDGIDLLIGNLFPRPVEKGGISFAPLIFFIVASILHQLGNVQLHALMEQLSR